MPEQAAAIDGATRGDAPGGVREVARIAAPAVLHTLSDTLVQVVDAAIVGRLGTAALGGVGFAGVWIWTITCAFVGAAAGVQTFVAQALGAGRPREGARWAWQAAWSMLPVATLVFLVARAGIGPFFALLGPTPELHAEAVEYARARLLGAPAVMLLAILNSFFRGLGDTRTPLGVALLANVANAALAFALVFGRFGLPRLGVAGAGYGAAFGSWLGALVLAVAFQRARARIAPGSAAVEPPDRRAIGRLLRTSAPVGGQWLLDMITFALFTTIIARMGDRSMAASQAMIQLLSLSFMQAVGIAIAAAALVGRHVGAGDLDAAERSHRSALRLGGALAGTVAALFLAFPESLLRIFSDDPGVLAIGRPLLRLGAFFQLVDAAGIITAGSLRGAGDTRWPFLVQSALSWLFRLPLVWFAAVAMGGGALGAWIAELCHVLVLGAVLLARFERRAWQRIRI